MKITDREVDLLWNKFAGYNDLLYGDTGRNMIYSEFYNAMKHLDEHCIILTKVHINTIPNDQKLGEDVRKRYNG